MTEERAVSEVLGYVLVIGLITTTIAVVLTLGVGGLNSAQTAEQLNNMERAFDVLDENVEAMVDRSAPTRSTELRLADGEVNIRNSTEFDIRVDDIRMAPFLRSDALIYELEDSKIIYDSGVIMRQDGDAVGALTSPKVIVTDDILFINLVIIEHGDESLTQATGPNTVQVEKTHRGTNIHRNVTGERFRMNVSSDHVDAWEQSFTDDGFTEGAYEGSIELDVTEREVIIATHRIRVEIVD